MRSYATVKALREGETVEVEGMLVRMLEGEIAPGDLYVGERNGPARLGICQKIEFDSIFGGTDIYPYDTWECVRVQDAASKKDQ